MTGKTTIESGVRTWDTLDFWNSLSWKKAQEFLKNNPDFVPPRAKIFRPLIETPLHKVKVVMCAREPYNGLFTDPDGFAYSTEDVVDRVSLLPEPLVGLFKDLKDSYESKKLIGPYNIRDFKHGSLRKWARQGVLLINTQWTTNRAGYGQSHLGLWSSLTMNVLSVVADERPDAVFVFDSRVPKLYRDWLAKKKVNVIVMPSPDMALFEGFHVFSRINNHLVDTGQEPIDWNT